MGIVAPASAIDREALQAGCARLAQLGYKPVYLDSIFDTDLYFAGTLDRRLAELEEMFAQDDVKAIICARGGYGCNYLLDRLNLDVIRSHPKVFVGYSDVSTLLTHITQSTGLVTFHGPMVTKDFAVQGGVDECAWRAAISGMTSFGIAPEAWVRPLVDGAADGIISGGCLSMLAASLGTKYEVQTKGTILFIEDIGTKPYQIDRMLMQMRLAGKFDGVRGIVFGEMRDCAQPGGQAYSLDEVLVRIVGDLGIPVAAGVRSGHVERFNVTIPFGVRGYLRVMNGKVEFGTSEAAVTG